MTTRVISRPTPIVRKGKKVRKKLSFLGGFENGAYNTHTHKKNSSKEQAKTQFFRFSPILSLLGSHCSKAILCPQRSQATQIRGGRNGNGVLPSPQGWAGAQPPTPAHLGRSPLPLQLFSHQILLHLSRSREKAS